ncbi:MAG: ribulose-phosphate 3-epimerase [Armatimonadetes bacterium]|nr:ribulose-phosphate 3-epimerase [Armatimonadota bacterium]
MHIPHNGIIVAPSMLCADFRCLAENVKQLEEAGADWLHFDVMDGHFVPNLTYGAIILEALRPVTHLYFDAHLMVCNPQDHIEAFAKAGANLIAFHIETVAEPEMLIGRIHELGCEACVAVNPETPLHAIEPLVGLLEAVLVMGVHPGRAGQSYIPETTERVKTVAEMIAAAGSRAVVAVDGGIKPPLVAKLYPLGARVFVSGSFLFDHPGGYSQAIAELRAAAKA